MFKYGYILLLPFLLGCDKSAEAPDYSNFNHIVKRGAFEIYLPKYLSPDKKINPKAKIAYADSVNNTIFILLKEEIPNTEKEDITIELENYYIFARQAIFNSLEDPKETDKENVTINLEDAIVGKIEGKYGGEKIFYCLTVIRTEEYFYQLIGWTLYKLKDTNGKDLCDAALSFVELN